MFIASEQTLSCPPVATVGPFTVARVQAFVLRWPTRHPVQTSFGVMHARPAILVRVEDASGASGWGEIWCNFPDCGAEHRAGLLQTVVAPLLIGQAFASARDAFDRMTARTAVLAIQSGEPGPIAQVIAGIDIALWDLLARRAGQPLWKMLGGDSDTVKVYASGINPERPQDVVLAKLAEGYTAFKLKVGFGEDQDLTNVAAVRSVLPVGAEWMVDANQAWDLKTAKRMAGKLQDFKPQWLEEPLRADQAPSQWKSLAESTEIPLAAGENLIGAAAFQSMIASQSLGVIQPDLAKWGGISGCLPVIEMVHAAGLRYCPHFLGAGIGLLASAHILAARGRANGMLEIDANENPLRTVLSPALNRVINGTSQLGVEAGLGVDPNIEELEHLCSASTLS